MSLEDCKYLYKEMAEKDSHMERTVLRDVESILSLRDKPYYKIHRIILNKKGDNVNLKFLEPFHYTLFGNEYGNKYLLYKNGTLIVSYKCPPTWTDIIEVLPYNSYESLFLLYHFFCKMLRLFRRIKLI